MKSVFKVLSRIVSCIAVIAIVCFASGFSRTESHGAEEVEQEKLKELSKEIIVLVNEARAENGLKPVYAVPYLCDVSQVRARECIFQFSHTRADGSNFATVIDDNLIPFCYAAENIAAGSPTAEATFEQWRNSPKHWEAILNPNITHMGAAAAYEKNSEYGWYWQQLFIQTWEPTTELPGQYIPQRYEIVPQSTGDLTGDGSLNCYDYIVLLDYLNKKKLGEPVSMNDLQMDAADCFQDGLITEADAKAMQRFILGEYKTLPYVY